MALPSESSQDNSDPPTLDTTVDAREPSGPFTDLTPHARGGLGEVFRATDPELHRTVAVKYLQIRHAANANSRRRFLLEAEDTARQQQPGVVPVYGLFADGERPAYSMRFVEGQTLAEAITAYHAGPGDPVAFRRLLQAFLQICQTVAYAHSRGVIHRDLKPSNVILGRFGETLVVDWGLAKVVGRPEEVRAVGAGETLVVSSGSGSGSEETAMGSAIGTPAYMSPEQAAGRWDVVDQSADVYSLGAVLYNVLTGRPPLERGNWPQMQQKIQRGDFPPPRQVKPNVSPPLEAVCLKAMALEPSARYPSPEALGAEVEHWLADEPVTAYREPIFTRGRRWAKRHRLAVSSAALLLVAAVIGLSVGSVLLGQAQRDTERQRQAAVAAQAKSEALNRFLIDDLLRQADPANNPDGDKITVRQLLDKAADRLDNETTLADQPEVEAEVRTVIGHAFEYLGVFDKAERHTRRGWELYSRLLGPDHPQSLAVQNRLIFTITNQGKRPEAEALARIALEDCDRILGDGHPETGDAANNLAELYVNQGRFDEAVVLRDRASRILNASRGPNDIKTLEIDNNLGVALVTAGQPARGVEVLQSVVDRRRKTSPLYSEFGVNLGNLGGALAASGQFAEAEAVLREAITLSRDRLGAEHPATFSARNLLAYALEGQGQWADSETNYLSVLADRRRVAGQRPFILRTVGSLARLYAKQERWPDAAPYLAEIILAQKSEPNRTLDGTALPLAAALKGEGKPTEAEPLLRECWESLQVKMWKGDWLTDEIKSRYGECLSRQGRYEEARPLLEAAARDISKAVGVPAWSLATARRRVADLHAARKRQP